MEVIGSGWPVQLHPPFGSLVQSPVYDSVNGHVFFTDNMGALYVISAVSGTIVKTDTLGIFSPSDPLVDSRNQTVFVFDPDSSFHLRVTQFDTSGTQPSRIIAGISSGNVSVFTGTFDNNYFTSPSSGSLYFAASRGRSCTLRFPALSCSQLAPPAYRSR